MLHRILNVEVNLDWSALYVGALNVVPLQGESEDQTKG